MDEEARNPKKMYYFSDGNVDKALSNEMDVLLISNEANEMLILGIINSRERQSIN